MDSFVLPMVSASTEGRVLIGYGLQRDEIMRDKVTPSCECEGNCTQFKFCPVCGTMNSPCTLAEGFTILYDSKQPITRQCTELPPLSFHGKTVVQTHDGNLIIMMRSEDIPPFASENSFTSRYHRGWTQMSIADLEPLRAELHSQLADIGITWDEERFGVYVVRPLNVFSRYT